MPEESATGLPVFGARVEGCPYVIRPSAYALVRNARGEVAIVRTPQGSYLPGGGIEAGETPERAVQREAMEESGLILEPRAEVGQAIEIVYSPHENACFEKRCVFLEADAVSQGSSQEQDHELMWVDLASAIRTLAPQSHRWALRRYEQIHASPDL